MAINFTPIVSAPNYESEKKTVKVSGRKKAKLLYILIFIPIFWLPLILYALSKIPAAIKQSKQREEALQNFARANNYSFGASKNIDVTPMEIALPYDAFAYQPRHRISGEAYGVAFEYIDTVMQPKNYNGIHSGNGTPTRGVNIFRIHLPIRMPGLFADSKFNNIAGFNIKVASFDTMQKYTLEGDFPDFYNVLAEKDTQIDVLSVLSPDVMEALIHNFHYDLWIHDEELMLIVHPATEIEYFAAIPLVFKNAEVLLKEIDKIARALRATGQ